MKFQEMGVRSVASLISLLLIFLFSLTSQAQLPILKRNISMELENGTLEKALIILSNEADFNFSYNSQIIDVDTIVSIHVENSTVKEVLDVILSPDISYTISGNHLILVTDLPKSERPKKNVKYEISGYVFDTETGKALVNVSVFDPEGLIAALTDSSGYYNISVASKYEQLNLFYSKKNFYDTLIIVQPANQEIDLDLLRRFGDVDIEPLEQIQLKTYSPVETLGLVQKFVPEKQRLQSENINVDEKRFAQISIWPNVGTNLKMSGQVVNKFSLNVLAGYSAGVEGLEIGGLVNIDRKNVKGLQIAGLGNVVGGTTSGAQIGGLFNNNRKNVTGLQLAGINNVILDTIRGVQIAGINNILRGTMHGWQVAGINNYTSESVDGVQIAGISNITLKDVDVLQLAGIINIGDNVNGFQVAGIINTARGTVGGWQIAGVTNYSKSVNLSQFAGIGNIAANRVRGAQIAVLFNYAKYVDGGQVSLFNIADSVGGVPVGLISFVRKGYHKLELSANEILYTNLTYKMGVRKFYNIFTGGVQPGSEGPIWGLGYGFGSQIGQRKVVFNMDLTGTQIMEQVEQQAFNVSFRLSTPLTFRLARGFSFFAGPALVLHVSDLKDPDTGEFITNLAPTKTLLWEGIPGSETLFQLWVGGTVGFRFF